MAKKFKQIGKNQGIVKKMTKKNPKKLPNY